VSDLRALLDVLDEDDLDTLAQRLAPRLQRRLGTVKSIEDGWLDTRGAAVYVGLTRDALRKLTASRSVPFEQECAGGKCWFKRSELDAWRRGEWQRDRPR
jgi:excisionase family DNA binding protein